MNFKHIYDTHKDLVYNLALQYSQNPEDAEEITQDVFLNVHKNIDTFQSKSNIKTWIYRIAINTCLDFLKAKKAKKRWTLHAFRQTDKDGNMPEIADFNHPGVELEQKEAMAAIFKAINQLPEKQKTAVILLKIEQLSQVEAAEILKVSPKAIESLFTRAKKNLKSLLDQNEGK